MTAGQTLAQFEILEALPEGEFGPAYKARDAGSGREVELEILPAARGSLDIDRLRQEVRAASALDHWSIAKIYDLARAGDVDFLVREHVSGRMLDQALPLSSRDALDCARQIAGALGAAHSIGVTHRHLNPGNVVLAAQNAPKLVNFGLTPSRRDEAYLAPEQLDGRGADARADIYAFGKLLEKLFPPPAAGRLSHVISRAVRKDAARRYQLMDEVQSALDRIADPNAPVAPQDSDRGHRLLLLAAAAVIAIIALGWWMFGGRGAVNVAPSRVTSDAGLTTEAAISSDGRTLVYASDRGSPGVLHIWIQPFTGGSPTRLTDGSEDDRQPALSRDAAGVVFRSERDGGGLYTVASTGGPSQLLVPGGRDPRYSPDGRWISYWTGDPLSPNNAAVWVIASTGGAPIRIQPDFPDARFPVWSPGGKHLLFVAHADVPRRNWNGEWYVAPFDNGSSKGRATRTGAESLLHMQKFRESSDAFYSGAFVIPDAWIPGQVLFSGRLTPVGGNNTALPHLLRIPLSDSIMQSTGAAHEVTSGANWDTRPSIASNGRLIFTRRQLKPQIWSFPAAGSAEPRRATPDEGEARFSVSADGKRVAYRLETGGRSSEFRIVDLDTGRQVARIPQRDLFNDWPPVISPAGDQLAYSADGLFRVGLSGARERISRRGGERIMSWSPDGKHLLVQRGWRGVGLIDTGTGGFREFLRNDTSQIVEARFSPDGKWVAFTVAEREHPQIFIVAAGTPEDRTEVTAGDVRAGSPAWSPDGNKLYFLNQCQGFRCIWMRRLDPRTRQPQGDAVPVRHFHHARYSLLSGIDPQSASLAAAGDKLIVGMYESTGNIWSLPALPRP